VSTNPCSADAERLDFRQQDHAAATAAYMRLAQTSDAGVRAHALIRHAGVLRRVGRGADALDLYDRLAEVGDVWLEGTPVQLVARHARCATLEELSRRDDLRREVAALRADLGRGRWRMSRSAYGFYVEEKALAWFGLRRHLQRRP
jgi:hypothetical protein